MLETTPSGSLVPRCSPDGFHPLGSGPVQRFCPRHSAFRARMPLNPAVRPPATLPSDYDGCGSRANSNARCTHSWRSVGARRARRDYPWAADRADVAGAAIAELGSPKSSLHAILVGTDAENSAHDHSRLRRDDLDATGATIWMRSAAGGGPQGGRSPTVGPPPAAARPTIHRVGCAGVIAAGRVMRVFSLFRRSARARPPCDRSPDEALHEASHDRPRALWPPPAPGSAPPPATVGAGPATAVGEARAEGAATSRPAGRSVRRRRRADAEGEPGPPAGGHSRGDCSAAIPISGPGSGGRWSGASASGGRCMARSVK